MIEAARHQAILNVLQLWAKESYPLDRILSHWGKENRYAGSKDRQAIAHILYGLIRKLGTVDWWIKQAGLNFSGDDEGLIKQARARLITYLVCEMGFGAEDFKGMWDDYDYRPYALGPSEIQLLGSLSKSTARIGTDNDFAGLMHKDQPDALKYNLPSFIYERLVQNYGAEIALKLAKALDQEAKVDLRVNRLKANQKGIINALEKLGIEAKPTPFAIDGIRLEKRVPITNLDVFKKGWVEPQDESAQIAAIMVAPKPGMQIIDWCAGAGGKSLAMAAIMENKGRLIAMDIDAARLERSKERLRRAGVHVVERKLLDEAGRKWLKRQLKTKAGKERVGFDRVLVDAPCSGSGTWRRNPDQKWRLDEAAIERLTLLQSKLIQDASKMVKVGGQLIYATCSLLAEENQNQIHQFLSQAPHYKLIPTAQIWAENFKNPYPGRHKDYLQLSPDLVESDGFFIAILERNA